MWGLCGEMVSQGRLSLESGKRRPGSQRLHVHTHTYTLHIYMYTYTPPHTHLHAPREELGAGVLGQRRDAGDDERHVVR